MSRSVKALRAQLILGPLPGVCAGLACLCLFLASCAVRRGPSQAERAYFDAYSNETRQTIAWWKEQVDTAQLIRAARGAAGSAQAAIATEASTKRDQAVETLRHEYGLSADEVQAVINGQMSRRIEDELSRGRKKLAVRIDRLEKIFAQTCKDFEKNPSGTVEELKRAENNVEKYLKGG